MSEWFYAKDGVQQGPVVVDEIRAMLAAGTLNAETDLVWNASMSDWLPAGKVPELASGALVSPADSVMQSQPFAYPMATGPLEEIVPGSEPIIATAVIKRAFDLTVRNWVPLVISAILFVVISLGLSFLLNFVGALFGFVVEQGEIPASAPMLGIFGYSVLTQLVSGFLSVFLMLGATRMCLDVISGRPISVGQLFGGGRFQMKAFGAYVLFHVMVVLGLLLFVFPGIYLALRYGMYFTAIVDKNMGVMDAFSYSSRLTQNNKMQLFVMALLTILVSLAGCLALGVGLLFAYPMIYLSWKICYRWLQFGGRSILDEPGTQVPLLAKFPE